MKTTLKISHILLIISTAFILITVIALTATAQINEKSTTISFTQQFKKGDLAVTDFNTSDGISLYSKNSVRHEKQISDRTVFTYEGADSAYPRVSNSDGIYISGTYDNSTIVFFIKETDNETKSMSLKTSNINEVDYFAEIESDKITPSSVSMAVFNAEEQELRWRKIITNASYDLITTDIDYGDCPFDDEKNAYMIALRVDSGMTCFESLQLSGLEIVQMNDCRETLFYENEVLMQGAPDSDNSQADPAVHFNLDLIKAVTSCEEYETGFSDPVRPLTIFLKNFYDFIIRVVNNLLSIFR